MILRTDRQFNPRAYGTEKTLTRAVRQQNRDREGAGAQELLTVVIAITSVFSYQIHFPVVAYPENGIFTIKSFVFCRKTLYSHSDLQSAEVA
jgi:hypothetical protein